MLDIKTAKEELQKAHSSKECDRLHGLEVASIVYQTMLLEKFVSESVAHLKQITINIMELKIAISQLRPPPIIK